MFKKVLLAGALLAPVLAYGGSPSTDLSVQIVPAASPTPPPPSPTPPPSPPPTTSLTPPAPAQAAGFTTLAENMDFTGSSTSEYNGTTFNAQVLSNWLDCAGATGSPALWQNDQSNAGAPSPRCAYSIINDGGTSALDIDLSTNDASNGYFSTEIQQCNRPGTVCYITFPLAKYYEIVMRFTPDTLTAEPNAPQGYFGDTWSWPTNNATGIEVDFVEFYGNGVASGGMPGAPNGTAGAVYSWVLSNMSQYHTYGMLVTSDGTSDVGSCTYYDGVATGCSDNGNVGSTAFNQRSFLIENVGPWSTTNIPIVNNMDMLIQRIRVWECASWASGPCNGHVFNGNPP